MDLTPDELRLAAMGLRALAYRHRKDAEHQYDRFKAAELERAKQCEELADRLDKAAGPLR